MFDYSGAYASPIRKRPMGDQQPMPSFLDGINGPERPGYGDSFMAGIQQNKNNGANRIMAGLSGWAGAGGIRGGIGTAARFLL